MIEKIPIVIPNKERNVLNLLIVTDLAAKIIVSLRSLKNIIWTSRISLKTKYKKNHRPVILLIGERLIIITANLLRIIKKYIFLTARIYFAWHS